MPKPDPTLALESYIDDRTKEELIWILLDSKTDECYDKADLEEMSLSELREIAFEKGAELDGFDSYLEAIEEDYIEDPTKQIDLDDYIFQQGREALGRSK
jgi:hypothetical protein